MRRKNLILWFLALLAVPASAQDSTPKVIDSRLSLGLYATRTSPTLPQTLDIDDPTASFQVFQVRPTTSSAYPFATFKHRTTLTGSDVSKWTFFTDASAGFNIRDEKNAATRLTIDSSGGVTIPGALVFSGLTASRLVVTDASKNLASNGSITTNALAKSASSGASLAASGLSDDGTAITAAEPLLVTASLQGNYQTFALTSGAGAATFVKVAIPSNSAVNLRLEYVFEASTATPHVQAFGGIIGVNAVNVGGTITCVMGVPTTATQPALAADGGTLTNAITCADATGGVLNILATDTSSITPTTNRIRYRLYGLAGTTLTVTAQ